MVTAVSGTIENLNMDVETARAYVEEISHRIARAEEHLQQARSLIFELKNRQGWRALGYASWSACVASEFEQCAKQVDRQYKAALVELDIVPNGSIGTYPERVLRPLTVRNFDAQSRQLVMDISQEIVGEGGRVTSGVVEVVVEGLKDMLASGALQGADGDQHPFTQAMSADLIARVREKKIAHKQHVQRMDKKRDYILGGVAIDKLTRGALDDGRVAILVSVDELQRAKLLEVSKRQFYTEKPIYVSLWIEE